MPRQQTPSFGSLLGHELKRLFSTPALWVLLLLTAFFVATAVYGSATTGQQAAQESEKASQALSDLLASMPFGSVLFITFFGIIAVASDFDSRFATRLFSLYKTPLPIIAVKLIAVAVPSVVLGAVGLVAGGVSAQVSLQALGLHFVPTMGAVEWMGRYQLCFVLAGMWGVALGFLFRTTVLAMAVSFLYETMVEPLLLKTFTSFGRFLPGGAQAAIIGDPSTPQRLDLVQGVLVYSGWVVVLLIIAFFVLRAKPQAPVFIRRAENKLSRRKGAPDEHV